MIKGELIVDNFAGGGGASTGIEMATGYSVDIAINHDPEAIRMHAEHEHRGRADRAAEVRVMNVAEGLKKRSE